MDRKLDWSWMQAHMPRTVAMIREQRAAGQGALINECWKRGVLQGEPGWFYALEGPVSVGAVGDEALVPPAVHELRKAFPGTVVLMLKGVPIHGSN